MQYNLMMKGVGYSKDLGSYWIIQFGKFRLYYHPKNWFFPSSSITHYFFGPFSWELRFKNNEKLQRYMKALVS